LVSSLWKTFPQWSAYTIFEPKCFSVGERMKMEKAKVQIYQKHPKVQVFLDLGQEKKKELSRLDNVKALR
jgi:hypothetical protein